MSIRPELREELLELSAQDRLALAEELFLSVEEEIRDPDVAKAWTDEIHARIEDIRSGRAPGRPADEVFARVRANLAANRR